MEIDNFLYILHPLRETDKKNLCFERQSVVAGLLLALTFEPGRKEKTFGESIINEGKHAKIAFKLRCIKGTLVGQLI
jgi:hypothetical protein